METSPTLWVAAVQFRSTPDLSRNVARIGHHLAELSSRGVRVAAFPECAATSYNQRAIEQCTAVQLKEAETELARLCRLNNMHLVVGIPYFKDGVRFNGGLVFNPNGRCTARYAKIQLAGERWCESGNHFCLFQIESVLCSMIICHDERYPELVRLPVLAGAQVIFYLSCESDITAESKIAPYRAQIQARAMENSVFVVHANTPMAGVRLEDGIPRGEEAASNGHSRIIRPDGNTIEEASIWGEDVLVADLAVAEATRHLAERSRQSPLLKAWWEMGMRLVLPPDDAPC